MFFHPLGISALCVLVSSVAMAAPPKPAIAEDFESTAAGAIPEGFTKSGAVAVVDDVAHSGKHSLRMEPAVKGGRKITKQGPELAALGGEHWGRLYYKVKLPVPNPVIPEGKTSSIIHATMVSGQAKSPAANDNIEVRMMGQIIGAGGSFKYLYNVQPKGGRPEFGVTSKAKVNFSDEWTLVEWHVDHAKQSYHFYVNGEEVKDIGFEKGAGQFEKAEIPSDFESLSFGWTNYQPASDPGFTVWIDDLAVGKERIGATK